MPVDNRKNPQELEADLVKIYADGEGKLPDFTRLDGKPTSRFKAFIGGSLIFLAAVAAVSWGGFFFFSRSSGFDGERVEVRMDTGAGLTAGQEAALTVSYANRERLPLASAALSIELPDGFTMTSAEPPVGMTGDWPLGTLQPDGTGEIRIKGLVLREFGATLTYRAKLRYKPADFNSEFEKVVSHTAVVNGSALALKGAGPEEMTPGDPIELVYEYENVSDRALEAVRFTIDPLDGFVFASADPKPDPDLKGQWTFDKIEARAKGKIAVKGTFASTARGPKQLHARIGQAKDGAFYVYAEADAGTNVLKSDLALSLIVNGSPQPSIASFGDTFYLTLNYENAGDVPLREVTLSVELPSEPAGTELIDWVSLKDDLAGKRAGAILTWAKKQIPDLALLKPGDKGAINLSVQLVRKAPAGAASNRFTVNARAAAKIGRAGSSGGREIVTEPLPVRLQSDAAFKSSARYFNEAGAPLGSGPMPPKVGEKTVYRIHWTIQNTLHELTDVSVSTVLPQGVKWTGVERPVDAGALAFDETGRKVVWRLNKMPVSVPVINVTFDVELTPEFEDIGKLVNLTGESRFEAVDKEIETVILKTAPPVGTDVIGDEFATGKGIVRE